MPSDDDSSSNAGLPEAENPQQIPLSIDAVLELLANKERRMLLAYFLENDDTDVDVEELVKYIMARKAKRTGNQPGHDQVYTALMHIHIPKLADVGLIEYDERSEHLRYWGNALLEDWLKRIQQADASDTNPDK